jgi:lipase
VGWTTVSVGHVFVRLLGDVDDGAPPLVLLHGFSDSGECWYPAVPSLSRRGRLALPDARGHGQSGLPDGPVTLEGLATDVVAVIEHLGRPSVLVGHSMGAQTAAKVAGLRPDLVVGVVLEDPPWRDGPDHPMLANDQVAQWLDALEGMTEEELAEGARRDNPRWDEAELGPHARSKKQLQRGFVERSDWRFDDWRALADAVAAPALLLTGDNGLGAIVTAEVADDVGGRLRRGTVARVEGAGHCIRRDQPAAWLAHVDAFLDAL